MLTKGDMAPNLRLTVQNGEEFSLVDLKGKIVVLYFYPKADTPGCTVESCAFRDHMGTFESAGAVIVGVSPDTEKAQMKFANKFTLPFKLIADKDHLLCEAFGVWVEKSMYGKKYMGVERATFIIDGEGIIQTVFPKVKIEGHIEETLAAVKSLTN